MAPEIPFDLLIEIVNKLPVKSLARFKCVSKSWSSLIRSQGHLFASSPRLYLNFISRNVILSLASTSKSSTVFDLDLREHEIGRKIMLAFRGLILYSNFSEQACIYNPTTRQRVTLPAINFNILAKKEGIKLFTYFLGYDPILDQYKVICTVGTWSLDPFCAQPWWVFALEAGSFWKRIEFDEPHEPQTSTVLCINGVIYYLAISSGDKFDNVISFNVRSEEFNIIQLPHPMSKRRHYIALIEYGGKPTIFDYTHLQDPSGFLNLWVLEGAEKWLGKSLVLQPCHMHFFANNMRFWVIGTTQNGEVVLRPYMYNMSFPYYILYYDLHKNDVRRVDIRGISGNPSELALMDTGENIMQLKI